MGIYESISSNKWKSTALLLAFVLFVAFVGWLFGYLTGFGIFGLILALMLASIYSVGSYYFSDAVVLHIAGAREVKKEDYDYLSNTVEGLSLAAGIPMPKMYIIEDPSPNAFATGRDPKHASIAVTTGLLKIMNRQELEGVIAHELSHVKNYDTRFMTLTIVLVGVISILADIGLRTFIFGGMRGNNNRDRGGGGGIFLLIFLILVIVSPIFAQLIRLAISRKREYLADANGALLTRYPEGLASALEKISMNSQPLRHATEATSHLYISNPLKADSLSNLFSTHPPIKDRIKILRSM